MHVFRYSTVIQTRMFFSSDIINENVLTSENINDFLQRKQTRISFHKRIYITKKNKLTLENVNKNVLCSENTNEDVLSSDNANEDVLYSENTNEDVHYSENTNEDVLSSENIKKESFLQRI